MMKCLSTFALAAVLGLAVSFMPSGATASPAPQSNTPSLPSATPLSGALQQHEATELAARPRYWRGRPYRNFYRNNYYRGPGWRTPYYRPYSPYNRPFYGPGLYFRLG